METGNRFPTTSSVGLGEISSVLQLIVYGRVRYLVSDLVYERFTG